MGTADEASKYPPLVVNPLGAPPPSWAMGNSCVGIPLTKANSGDVEAVVAAWVTWVNSWSGGPTFEVVNLLIGGVGPTEGMVNPVADDGVPPLGIALGN